VDAIGTNQNAAFDDISLVRPDGHAICVLSNGVNALMGSYLRLGHFVEAIIQCLKVYFAVNKIHWPLLAVISLANEIGQPPGKEGYMLTHDEAESAHQKNRTNGPDRPNALVY
jgi:hypothetical protein